MQLHHSLSKKYIIILWNENKNSNLQDIYNTSYAVWCWGLGTWPENDGTQDVKLRKVVIVYSVITKIEKQILLMK